MSNWEVKLKGDDVFLKELAEEYVEPEISVTFHKEGYFLKSEEFNQLGERSELFEKAGNILEFINASSKVFANKLGAVEPDGFWVVDSNGERKEELFGVGIASVQFQNILMGIGVAPKEWYQIWKSNEAVKYVFRLLLSETLLDWFSLFKIYETIRDDDGHLSASRKGIEKIESWTSVEQNKIFHKTANWHRHTVFGKSKGKVNEKPLIEMTLSEGNNYILGLTKVWLVEKAKQTP